MSLRLAALLSLTVLAACAPAPRAELAQRQVTYTGELPPMRSFGAPQVTRPVRSNASIARDFLDLSFALESGRTLPVLTRFERPVTIRAVGPATPALSQDLDRLVARLRREAGIDIRRVAATEDAAITVQTVSRRDLQGAVPQAACFVVPRLGSWAEFKRNRRSAAMDWTTLKTRERMAVFIPADVAPQEVRDCLHEEVAQALGPLNDLYSLTDSVYNDDNFHTVLTGFDMLILRATYAPELRSGMTRDQVAARLPAILARLNPEGENGADPTRAPTPRDWIDQIEIALGPSAPSARRRAAAERAVAISRPWNDNRSAFALFALGRLSLASDPELALAAFLKAGAIYGADPDTRLQAAHVAMQLAAFTLSTDQPEATIEIVDANIAPVVQAENAALLASLMLIKAEALDILGRSAEARVVRRESLGWARYGFGTDDEVRRRAGEIAALNPLYRKAKT